MYKCIAGLALLFASSCFAGGCDPLGLDKKTCPVLKDFTVADTANELRFTHPCSSLDNHNGHSQEAYAFFSATDKGQKALVLGSVVVGHLMGSKSTGISIELEQMRITTLAQWSGKNVAIALGVQNNKTQKSATGPFSTHYFYSYQGSGPPVDLPYNVSETGTLDWKKLTEPERVQEGDLKNEYKGSEAIHIERRQLTDIQDEQRLFLVLRNQSTKEQITLQGPVIRNLAALLTIKFSEPRRLSIWDILNPAQEGGLWDTITDASRYGDCIYLRKQAKKEFRDRFDQTTKNETNS